MGAEKSDRSRSCVTRHYISGVCRSLSLTLSSTCGRLLLGTKREFTTGTRRAKSSRCSGGMLHYSPPPMKFRTLPSGGKGETHGDHFFGDSKGLLLIDYLPPKTTTNGQYYAYSLLLKLRDAIKEKCRGMLTRGVWLLHDNAPIHKSMIAQQAVRDCGFVQLDHHTVLTWLPVTIFCSEI